MSRPVPDSNVSQSHLAGDPPWVLTEARLLAEGRAAFTRDQLRRAIAAVDLVSNPLGAGEPFDPSTYPAQLTVVDASEAGELFLVHAGDGRSNPHLAVLRHDGFESVTLFATTPTSSAIMVAHELAIQDWIADHLADGGM